MSYINRLVEKIIKSTTSLDLKFIDEAAKRGITIFYFNGKDIHNKTDFFKKAKSVMQLPDYSTDNWDSFEECINDLFWINSDGYIFVYDNTDVYFSKHKEDEKILMSILADAVENWEGEKVPFELVIVDDRELFKISTKMI